MVFLPFFIKKIYDTRNDICWEHPARNASIYSAVALVGSVPYSAAELRVANIALVILFEAASFSLKKVKSLSFPTVRSLEGAEESLGSRLIQ